LARYEEGEGVKPGSEPMMFTIPGERLLYEFYLGKFPVGFALIKQPKV
jgi:hypothetical protein